MIKTTIYSSKLCNTNFPVWHNHISILTADAHNLELIDLIARTYWLNDFNRLKVLKGLKKCFYWLAKLAVWCTCRYWDRGAERKWVHCTPDQCVNLRFCNLNCSFFFFLLICPYKDLIILKKHFFKVILGLGAY